MIGAAMTMALVAAIEQNLLGFSAAQARHSWAGGDSLFVSLNLIGYLEEVLA